MAMYLGNQSVKILAPSINLFNKSLIELGGTDFAECSEYELSADKNTLIARGNNDDTTMDFGYARGWVRGGCYESSINSKGIKLKKGDIVTVSADFTLIEQGNRSAAVRCYLMSTHPKVSIYDTVARSISETPQRITWKFTVTDDAVDFYPCFPINSNKVKIENISVNKVKDYWRIRSGVNMGRNPKNLIPFPYKTNDVQWDEEVGCWIADRNGIKWTVHKDGTITANGTATGGNSFIYLITSHSMLQPNKKYTISGIPKGLNENGLKAYLLIDIYQNGEWISEPADTGNGDVFTAVENGTYSMPLIVLNGTTLDNVTFKPMLNEGTKALPYFYYD